MKSLSVCLTVTMVVLLLAAHTALASSGRRANLEPGDPKLAEKEGAEMVSHQLLVKFKSENAALERQKLFKKYGGYELERVTNASPLFLVQFEEGTDILALKNRLAHEEGVDYAEPNIRVRVPKNPGMPLK